MPNKHTTKSRSTTHKKMDPHLGLLDPKSPQMGRNLVASTVLAKHCKTPLGTQGKLPPKNERLTRDKSPISNRRYIFLETLNNQNFLWLFQLDDSKPLLGKWSFHQTSIENWVFRVPGSNGWFSIVMLLFRGASIVMLTPSPGSMAFHQQDDQLLHLVFRSWMPRWAFSKFKH